ncbi:DUF382-domain-containing protein [Wallemia mellicola]|nr:DUF382-domain-containing protein [Wallemia mellicola]
MSTPSESKKKSQLSKNQLKRLKKKNKPVEKKSISPPPLPHDAQNDERDLATEVDHKEEEINVEELPEEFKKIFEKFQPVEEEKTQEDAMKNEWLYSDDDEDEDNAAKEEEQLSKKKLRRINRLSVAELKSLVAKPEIVEAVDTTSRDPRLLVHLKSYKNTIPVPSHWSQKRGFLEGKKGIEKPSFQLPSYIADTGIGVQQDAVKEREAEMSLKQKTRQRVQPRMGKMDIDYQKLHDAFFKFQTKPPMSDYGETYYEGKEFETYVKERKPGEISTELKEALSIPPLAPPPWLIAMQRYGPPPSYPNLKIPGLNYPIPEGAQWGFHPGGWGKPPTDEYNRPLYGDVFGVIPKYNPDAAEEIDKSLWGEILSDEDQEDSSEEESESEEEEEEGADEGVEEMDEEAMDGMETPSGMASVATSVPGGGLETPAFTDIRKGGRSGAESVVDSKPRELYQVIPEKQTSVDGLMGSERGYDFQTLGEESNNTRKRKTGDVELAIDPEELANMTSEEIKQAYEEQRRSSTNRVHVPGADRAEDFTDILQEEQGKRQKREERRRADKETSNKEKFKF